MYQFFSLLSFLTFFSFSLQAGESQVSSLYQEYKLFKKEYLLNDVDRVELVARQTLEVQGKKYKVEIISRISEDSLINTEIVHVDLFVFKGKTPFFAQIDFLAQGQLGPAVFKVKNPFWVTREEQGFVIESFASHQGFAYTVQSIWILDVASLKAIEVLQMITKLDPSGYCSLSQSLTQEQFQETKQHYPHFFNDCQDVNRKITANGFDEKGEALIEVKESLVYYGDQGQLVKQKYIYTGYYDKNQKMFLFNTSETNQVIQL